jgi:hypothetical protein
MKERRVPATPYQLLSLAATLSLLAALIHLWVAPEHFAEWWGYGAFFVAVAALQASYAVAVVRWPRPWLLRLGILGNLALIALWIWTRTIGLPPVGPAAGEVEPVGGLDVVAKLAEVGVVALLGGLLWQLAQRWRSRRRHTRALAP